MRPHHDSSLLKDPVPEPVPDRIQRTELLGSDARGQVKDYQDRVDASLLRLLLIGSVCFSG